MGEAEEVSVIIVVPKEELAIRSAVMDAMQAVWDDICTDTGCHPLDIRQLGRKRLAFVANHWARGVADQVWRSDAVQGLLDRIPGVRRAGDIIPSEAPSPQSERASGQASGGKEACDDPHHPSTQESENG